jgi:hypothetical protein
MNIEFYADYIKSFNILGAYLIALKILGSADVIKEI